MATLFYTPFAAKVQFNDPRFEACEKSFIVTELTPTEHYWDGERLYAFEYNGKTTYAGLLKTEEGAIWLAV